MSRHAFAAYGLHVSPRYRPDERLSLDDIGGTKASLLSLIHGLLQDLKNEPLREEKSEDYLYIDEVDPLGARIHFNAEYGKFGLEGGIRHTRSHETTHTYGTDESATVPIRNMILCLSRSKTAVFLTERYGNRGVGSIFLRQLQAAFRAKFSDLILHSESFVDNEQWRIFRERAKLTSVKVVRYSVSHDPADGIDRKVIGKIVYEAKPRWGVVGLGNKIKSGLLGGELNAHQLLGLSDVQDTDETRLTLSDGDQERQVVLGREDLPALVYTVDHDGKERAKDSVVYNEMHGIIPVLTKQLGLELPGDWESPEWQRAQLTVKMGAVRER
ncbi:hypothetical protein [Micromonospora wenchangensis]|uniref:hypothetical protein n=1 Tax=Micromonospora wenchangensis TaxID=1185415 RepID=UPI003D747943